MHKFNGDNMHKNITAEQLQQLRNDGMDGVADEIERLQICERRLLVLARWVERYHPGDFKIGLWDEINA